MHSPTCQNQFLLDNLVDVDRQYTFDIAMDAPMERKKRFVAIRSQARDTANTDDSGFVSGKWAFTPIIDL